MNLSTLLPWDPSFGTQDLSWAPHDPRGTHLGSWKSSHTNDIGMVSPLYASANAHSDCPSGWTHGHRIHKCMAVHSCNTSAKIKWMLTFSTNPSPTATNGTKTFGCVWHNQLPLFPSLWHWWHLDNSLKYFKRNIHGNVFIKKDWLLYFAVEMI